MYLTVPRFERSAGSSYSARFLSAGSFCFAAYGRSVGRVNLTATAPGYSSATRSFLVRPPASVGATRGGGGSGPP